MAGLDAFTISVASTLSGRTLTRAVTGPVNVYDMEGMARKIDLLFHFSHRNLPAPAVVCTDWIVRILMRDVNPCMIIIWLEIRERPFLSFLLLQYCMKGL